MRHPGVFRTAWTLLAGWLLVAGAGGCAPDYVERREVPSPDGKWIVDVVYEVQGANDPDPLWRHISLRKSGTPAAVLPGNVGVFSVGDWPDVTWRDATTVDVVFRGSGGQMFALPAQPITLQGITFTFRCAEDFTAHGQ